ncbi:YciI family protein [Paenibacillus sp. UNC451MF]|uniref:YciI family protein n=1 Tax=Paenibacillus sp. UNC451MF TaxID=1449063 RepID=UPI00048C1B5D|nr:YciI family protein [Paenibacillus sp. UNC451MF]
MNYTLLMYETTEDFAKRTDPVHKEAYAASWAHYVTALRDSGIVVSSAGLQSPETGTTLSRKDGKLLVQDGPVAETKEQIGGLIIIDVSDMDAALEWAARCPGSSVEVRPNLQPILK